MERISKTKVRGVISLMKQARIIDVDWQGNRELTEEEQQQINGRLCEGSDTPNSDTIYAPAKLGMLCYIFINLNTPALQIPIIL